MDSDTKLKNKLDKWEQKSDKYKASVNRLEMKSQAIQDKQDKPMKTHSVTIYRDTEAGGKLGIRVETTHTTKSEHEKHRARGVFHKLDAHIKTENLGNTFPTMLRDAVPYTKKTLLNAENFVLKTGDAFKHTTQPFTRNAVGALRTQISNQVYKSAQENTGLKATVGAANAAITTGRTLQKWSSNRKKYLVQKKGLRLEQRTQYMKSKVDKLEMKSAVAKEKYLLKELKSNAKANGLDVKLTRAEKKKSWKKVFDGAQKSKSLDGAKSGKIFEKPEMKAFQKASKTDVLAAKEFKQAAKVYETKLVKEKYVNTATGKTKTRYKRVVDKSKKKVQKPKKPDDLFTSVSKMGLGALGNKAMSELTASDDVGVQALGKGLQFGASEISKAHRKSVANSKLKFEKKMSKAQMKMEKAHNKLEFEQRKAQTPKPTKAEKKSKKAQKKAQKKAAAKNRNAKQFKENLKKQAKKLKDKAAAEVKQFIKKKMLPAFIGVGFGVVILLLIGILPILLLGGGTGSGGVLAGMSVYPVDNKILTDTLLAYNDELNVFFDNCVSKIAQMEEEYGQSINISEGIYNNVRYNFAGVKATFRYDIFKMASYLSAKYRNDWSSAEAECRSMIKTLFELDCKEENGDHFHTEWEAQIGSTKDGKAIMGKLSTDIYNYYIYPKDGITLEQYIQEQLSNIGEPNEDGKTEYELHYDFLMEAYGGHQKIGTPLPDFKDWTSSAKTSIYEHIPPSQAETIENCIGIACGSGKKVTAGGDGVVTSIGDGSITVTYGDDFVVTYYGNVSSTDLELNSVVAYGDVLFKTSDGEDGSPYNLQISVYDNSVGSYVNPAFVMEGYEGQMEDNKRRQEEALEPETEE